MAYRFYRRRFLNRPGHHSTAFVWVEVPDTSKDDKNNFYDYECRIADCGKQIDLDFSTYDRSDRSNGLRKLDILIDTLTRFREAFAAECELAEEREKAKKAERAATKRSKNSEISPEA